MTAATAWQYISDGSRWQALITARPAVPTNCCVFAADEAMNSVLLQTLAHRRHTAPDSTDRTSRDSQSP